MVDNCPMTENRARYVIDAGGWDSRQRLRTTYEAMDLLTSELASAECDLPWSVRDDWPAPVQDAATRLRDTCVPVSEHNETHMTIAETVLEDPGTKRDFVLLASYTYFARFWDASHHEVADLNDHNTSNTWVLTRKQRDRLALLVEPHRVVDLSSWHREQRNSGLVRRLLRWRQAKR